MSKIILIVDDDDDLRKSLKVGLEKDGFSIIAAESAETAAKILERVSVSGIVLDRMMTGADGLSFLKKFRGEGDLTPVLMLTAMDGAENAIDGLSSGADDYLAKPFHLKELSLRLNNLLKNSESDEPKMPAGLSFTDGEFFVGKKLFALSEPEKKILLEMARGGTIQLPPMPAKRFRDKILANLKNVDIITVRGKGYKLIGVKK